MREATDTYSATAEAEVTNGRTKLTVNLCEGCLKNAPSVGWKVGFNISLRSLMDNRRLPGCVDCDFCAHDVDFSPTLSKLDEMEYGTIEPPLAGVEYNDNHEIMTAEEIEARDQAEYNDYTRSIPTPQDWNR